MQMNSSLKLSQNSRSNIQFTLGQIQQIKMLKNVWKSLRTIKRHTHGKELNLSNNSKGQNVVFSSQLNSCYNKGYLATQKWSYLFSDKKADNFKKKVSKEEMFKAQEEQLMKQQPDDDPTSYDKASGISGKIFMACGVLCMIGGIAYLQYKEKNQQSDIDQNITGVVALKQQTKRVIGSEWSLINHKGQAFSSSDLSGSYYLIYFGFTKCPDICPATLIKLSRVLRLIRKMPQNSYLNLKVVFVSCDPDRDTPKRLNQYLKNFDQEIIGVTGLSNQDPQLINCMKSFRIYSNKIPMQDGQYSIDHTTITYLMDDTNKYVDHLNPNLTEQQMSKAIVNRILESDYKKMQKRKSQQNAPG